MTRRLHVGGEQPHPDWEIFNIQKAPNVDHVGDACDLSRFTDQYDYHYTGLCSDFIRVYLAEAGFRKVRKVENFGIFKDASTICIGNIPISLNVIAFNGCGTHRKT